ncbi:o-succinylbenzoate synthase [bacterium]|nr:o-succinylbenzoate synthase [bacterium]
MNATIYSQQYPLHRPFRSSGWEIVRRDVILLRISDGTFTGWGEAAPLLPFGTESLERCQAALTAFSEADQLSGTDADTLLNELDSVCPQFAQAPTARFAAESALRDFIARREGISLAAQLSGEQPGNVAHEGRIPLNAVVGGGSAQEAAAAAGAAVEAGFRCIKMKVGAADLEEDEERLRAVRMVLPADMPLRLDANGAWDFGEAEEAMRLFAPYGIEYIEQPVPAEEVDELAALAGLAIIPVAADESTTNPTVARELLQREAVHVLVLKPMAMGGLQRVRTLALEAYAKGIDVVLTSLIDGAVGRSAVARLAASLPFPLRSQGLATGAMFTQDSARDTIEQGDLILPSGSGIGFDPEILETS